MFLTQNYCMHTQTLEKGFSFLLKKEIKFECIVGLGCEFYLRSVGYVLFVM